jgi:6-phosphogluconate dehydrogenase
LILFQVACFNRTVSKVDHFINNEAKGTKIIGAHSVEELIKLLKKPRRVMLLVQAGQAVDDFIKTLVIQLNLQSPFSNLYLTGSITGQR